jgi:UDP-N-acetylmuramate--alanine ligase
VVALGDLLGVDREKTKEALQKFKGARRRFEFKGSFNGADLIDDYGHHPTEIKATLNALAEKYSGKKKIVVFWPHQYKRIKPFLQQFAEVFKKADEVILKPIFLVPGRDELLKVSSSDLVDLINQKKKIAQVLDSDEKITTYLKTILDKDSVLLTIGIPPVYKIADKLAEKEVK